MKATHPKPSRYLVEVYEIGKSAFHEGRYVTIDGEADQIAEFSSRKVARGFSDRMRAAGHVAISMELVRCEWVDGLPEGWWETAYEAMDESR